MFTPFFRYLIVFVLIFMSMVTAQPRYVTTIFPFQNILSQVVPEDVTVFGILPAGSSPHTFSASPGLYSSILSATALLYGAKNLDAWVLQFDNAVRIQLLDCLPPDSLLVISVTDRHGQARNVGTDPHFWTDPLMVKSMLPKLITHLSDLDKNRALIYEKKATIFALQLDSLHETLEQQLQPLAGKKVILSHPFFQYFCQRYQLSVGGIVSPIPGKEPTPRDIQRMIKYIRSNEISAILQHAGHREPAVRLIAESTGIRVIDIDPLGGVAGLDSYSMILMECANQIVKGIE
ncbi:zinc ABC transporter substrate-binding protein [bacterium]|nr:zinc ABC transporter substrate-binding protein [bacterium]